VAAARVPNAAVAAAAPALAQVPAAQVIADAQLRVTEATENCQVVFGVPRERALGQHVLDAVTDRGVLNAVLKALSAVPASGRHDERAVHEASGRVLRITVSRSGRDRPVTIEAREEP
jgi:hypothetical protein